MGAYTEPNIGVNTLTDLSDVRAGRNLAYLQKTFDLSPGFRERNPAGIAEKDWSVLKPTLTQTIDPSRTGFDAR